MEDNEKPLIVPDESTNLVPANPPVDELSPQDPLIVPTETTPVPVVTKSVTSTPSMNRASIPAVPPPLTTTPPPAPPGSPANKSSKAVWWIVLVTLIVVILVATGIYLFGASGTDDLVSLQASAQPSLTASTEPVVEFPSSSPSPALSATMASPSVAPSSVTPTQTPTQTQTQTAQPVQTTTSTPTPTVTPTQTQAQIAVKTVNNAPKLTAKNVSSCNVLVPEGWTTSGFNGQALDVFSPNGEAYAGWGGLLVQRALQPYYGDLYGDPETSMAYLAGEILKQQFGDTGGVTDAGEVKPVSDGVEYREFSSAKTKGLVWYRIIPMGGDDYYESVHYAITRAELWGDMQDLVASVSASINCKVVPKASSSGSSGSGSSSSSAGNSSDGVAESTYNKELGTEYVHDSSTGENYLVSPSTDYVDGPQGYGAYKQVGNDYIKLEDGRSD